MTNPYQPPQDRLRFAPFPKRLLRGVRLAIAEYGRGLKREKLSPVRHFLSWCALIIMMLILTAWITSIGFGVSSYIRSSGF